MKVKDMSCKTCSSPHLLETINVVAGVREMASALALQIVAVFAVMFMGITIAALWFAHSSSKVESKKELQKRKMEIIDKHFSEMVRIECPYCRTIYTPNKPECPNCRANTKKILFPEIPE
jgi:hypothetical protein